MHPPEAFSSFRASRPVDGRLRLVVARRAVDLGPMGHLEWPDDFTFLAEPGRGMQAELAELLGKRSLPATNVWVQSGGGGWHRAASSPASLGLSDGALLDVIAVPGEDRPPAAQLCWWASEVSRDEASGEDDGEARSRGNAHVKLGEWSRAEAEYSRGLALRQASPSDRAALFSNRSMCRAKLHAPLASLRDANAAEKLRPGWAKAVARQAAALALLGQFTEAFHCYARANTLEKNKEFERCLAELSGKDYFQDSLRVSLLRDEASLPVSEADGHGRQDLAELSRSLEAAESPELWAEAQVLLEAWLAAPVLPDACLAASGFDMPTAWAKLLPEAVRADVPEVSPEIPPAARLCTEALAQPLAALLALRLVGVGPPERLVVHVAGAREDRTEGLGGDSKWRALAPGAREGAEVHLVGPELQSRAASIVGDVAVHRCQALYEDFLPTSTPPHVVLCQHCGIHDVKLREEWRPALEAMLSRGLLVVLTMYDHAEWMRTAWTVYEYLGLRPNVLFTGRNPYCSLKFGVLADQVPFSCNQWLFIFQGR